MAKQGTLQQRLQQAGLRATRQRLEILVALEQAGQACSAEEIFRRCAPGQTNLSTVYRTLNTFCQVGVLCRTLQADGVYTYYLAGAHHRHQLVCTACGLRLELPFCPMAELEQTLTREAGFRITGHSLELTGLCPRCKKD